MAHGLYNTVATGFGNDPKGWASTAPAHVLSTMVSYSLRQVSEWLAGGGMSLGASPRHACMVDCDCPWNAALQAHGMHACALTAGQQLRPWINLEGLLLTCSKLNNYMATTSNSCL